MSDLNAILARAIKTVSKIAGGTSSTKTLKVAITLEVHTGDETTSAKKQGRRLYGSPVSYRVMLTSRTQYVAVEGGAGVGLQVSSLQFLEPLMVTVRDRITLPDGTHPEIVSVDGGINPITGLYFAPVVNF